MLIGCCHCCWSSVVWACRGGGRRVSTRDGGSSGVAVVFDWSWQLLWCWWPFIILWCQWYVMLMVTVRCRCRGYRTVGEVGRGKSAKREMEQVNAIGGWLSVI